MNVTLARIDRGPRRRRARRPHHQGDHSGRVISSDPAYPTSSTRRPASTACRKPDRSWARPGSSCSTTRPAWSGSPRTCSTSIATNPAASAHRAVRVTDWLHKILRRIERGDGQPRDLDLLSSISGNVAGKTLCAFGDAAVTPVLTTLKHFRHEYEAHINEGRCTLPAEWRARQAVGAH